ncbi:Hypothetical protein GLP15_561 [Giardia lamblia P15]|uniref:Uncharacterized protein n=1 Tax=Giardia intestinalis (strain P15) TaxID=658858 RepID=E1F207_GIAIA|nr:Hypothetical protein GLP15_561 [Giardia lamblia P15]
MLKVDTIREAEETLEEFVLQVIQSNECVVTLWLRGVTFRDKRMYLISVLFTVLVLYSYTFVPNSLGAMALTGIYYIVLRTNWSRGEKIIRLFGVNDGKEVTDDDVRCHHILAESIGRRFGKTFKRVVDAYRAYSKFGLDTDIRKVYPIFILLGSSLFTFYFTSTYHMVLFLSVCTYLWGPIRFLLKTKYKTN